MADRGYKNMGRSRIQEQWQIADTRIWADRGHNIEIFKSGVSYQF